MPGAVSSDNWATLFDASFGWLNRLGGGGGWVIRWVGISGKRPCFVLVCISGKSLNFGVILSVIRDFSN